MSITITFTIPGVDRWGTAASAARALGPVVGALLLSVLEDAVPGLGVALAFARSAGMGVSVAEGQSESLAA